MLLKYLEENQVLCVNVYLSLKGTELLKILVHVHSISFVKTSGILSITEPTGHQNK